MTALDGRLSPGVHLIWPTVPVYVFDADAEGPTCLVQAGIHGDEIAGAHALAEILEEEWRPVRGRLLIIPVMNPPAYRARTRAAPGGLDLNRCFPGDPDAERYEPRLAHRFLQLVKAERPALVATLHESLKRYDPEVRPSYGQSLVYGVDPAPGVLERVCRRLNDEALASEEERWAIQYDPVPTSSTEVIVDAIGCVGTCVETWMGFPEPRRIEMQKQVVRYLLEDFGLLGPSGPRRG